MHYGFNFLTQITVQFNWNVVISKSGLRWKYVLASTLGKVTDFSWAFQSLYQLP